MNLQDLRDRWSELTPERRRIIKFVVIGIVVVVVGSVFRKDKVKVKQREEKPEMTVVTAARHEEGLGEMRTRLDSTQSSLDKERAAVSDLKKEVHDLKEGNKETENRQVQDLLKEVGSLREEVKLTRTTMMDPGAKTDKAIGELPPPLDAPKKEVVEVARPHIIIHGDDDGDSPPTASQQQREVSAGGNRVTMASAGKDATPVAGAAAAPSASVVGDNARSAAAVSQRQMQYLPPGTKFEGILLNGADVPTSGQAQKNTVPVLMRIKERAILPNRVTQDMRECFVILSGYGVMSSERAKFRSEAISCVRADGGVVDAHIDGYTVDDDGKEGIRGTLVTKQGSVLARGMIAGFMSGFGQMLSPSLGSSLMLNSSSQSYLSPNVGAAAEAGAARGASQAASDYAKFFLELAKEMHPVIEIPSGVPVTVILVRGVSLALNSGAGRRSDLTTAAKQSWSSR